MSWAKQLYDTYEYNAGKYTEAEEMLTPIAHMCANSQLEITVDRSGNFVSAAVVNKADRETLIPVTEKSAGRSSGIMSHPLCDTLSYVAGDYEDYCEKEGDKKKARQKYLQYIENLKTWSKSEFVTNKVKAIYAYLSNKTLIRDLVSSGIVSLENGAFDKKKIEGNPYEKVLVRFRVIGLGDVEERVWKDAKLIDNFIKYYLQGQNTKKDICYITGEQSTSAINHPKGIVAMTYGAKLVSANDNIGFTFRGRFDDSSEACTISYEASQKIHSALTWLVKNQGVIQGGTTYICWNPKGKKTPDIFNIFNVSSDDEEGAINPGQKKILKKILNGYAEQFDESDEVIFMALDAATTGRLSITYYNEQNANALLDSIYFWTETFRWEFYGILQTPPFWMTINCAFGTQRENRLETDDKIYKEQIKRLVKCLLEKQPFPLDIVIGLKNRASNPLAYSKTNREKILSVACASIMKYRIDHKIVNKEDVKMQLDVNNHNRSYLFGRLLAVFEKVEKSTYSRDEGRETSAIRLQAAYVNHPMQTWLVLEQALNPYFQKLTPGSREYYRKQISEIVSMFLDDDKEIMNQPLKEDYLLGYYLQRAELYKRYENKENYQNEEE